MVSENAPHCHSGLMCDGNKGQKEQLEHKEERLESSLFQQSQTVEDIEENATATKVKFLKESEITSLSSANNDKVDELEESAAKTENDPVNGVKHSDKYDDSIRVGGESEIKSVSSSATNKREPDEDKEVNKVKDTSPTSQTVSTVTKEQGELEESAAKSECDPVKPPADLQHSKNDGNTTVGGESEFMPVQSAATEKGNILMNITITGKGQSSKK
ncbi:uncharacterized protein PEZ65_013985 [Lycodopsis pacificus]